MSGLWSMGYNVRDVESRLEATMWAVEYLGVPKGFDGPFTYSLHVDEVMDAGGFQEEYIVDCHGEHVAYLAWFVGNDIHHHGEILSVHSMVINPEATTKGLRVFINRYLHHLAKLNECSWVSRYKHDGDTLRNYFKEVK